MPSGIQAVTAGSDTVTVAGAFTYPAGYTLFLTPSWQTGAVPTSQTTTQFVVAFSVTCPAGGGTLQWEVVGLASTTPAVGLLTAGDIINAVRDLIPDPVYDSGGNPLPDADGGLFRASTLYRWLGDGMRQMAFWLKWTVTDWYAVPAVANQPSYAISPLFHVIDQAFGNQQGVRLVRELESIVPGRGTESQPVEAFVHRATDHLEIGWDPVPSASDPATTLNGAIASAGADPILLTSQVGFLSYGFAMIETELIQYQATATGPPQISAISRGVGGTLAVAHGNGATVKHCALWVKGRRVPGPIVSAVSPLEIPLAWVNLLNWYLLAQALESQQESQRARFYLKDFREGCEEIAKQFGGGEPVSRRTVRDQQPLLVPAPNEGTL